MSSAKEVAIVGTHRTLGEMLSKHMKSAGSVLPKHITAERMMRLVLLAANRQPLLLQCTQESLLQSVMQAATLGLEINSGLGSAYLVPYKNTKEGYYEAQFIPGYRGLADLAWRGNRILLDARLVYKGDHFKPIYGTEPRIEHWPTAGSNEDEVTHCYAVAKLPGGQTKFEVMSIKQLNAVKARSKAKDYGPWKSDENEMRKKTVVRRVCKLLPLSPELAAAIEASDRADAGETNNSDALLDTAEDVAKRAQGKSAARAAELTEAARRKLDPKNEVEAEPPREREPGEEG